MQDILVTDQVTHTKVVLPRRRADLISRQRLLDLFFNLLNYKFSFITAPAGYGKTSLLIDAAHQSELPTCWYSIDALDNNPQRFIAHFIAAIAHCFSDFGQQSATALNESRLNGSADLERLVTIITNEIYQHIQEHFIFILDDYHLVGDNQGITYFINQFINKSDENCHLIISSRSKLNLPDLVLLVSRAQVAGFGLNQLAFQPDEFKAMALQNYHLTVPESVAQDLVQETEGWITALLLSIQTIWQDMTNRLRLAQASDQSLYSYLAQQVFDQHSPAIQDFLLRTSLLEEFSAPQCEAIFGSRPSANDETWSNLMDTITQKNLFVLPVEDKKKDTWLRYHHLFQEFLQSRMETKYPAETEQILRRLADWSMAHNDWERAYTIYFNRLDDVPATLDLIEKIGRALIDSGQFLTLNKWLSDLPDHVINPRPALLLLLGLTTVMLGKIEDGLLLENRAIEAFRQQNNLSCLAQALADRSVALRFLADYRASLADAEEALTLIQADQNLLQARAEALRAKGLSLYHMGQLNQAVEWMKQSLEVYSGLNKERHVAVLLMELGMVFSDLGAYNQALTYYNRAREYWQKTQNITWQAHLFNSLGVLYYAKGDYIQAKEFLEKAIDCANQSGYTRLKALALAGVGDLYTIIDPDAATVAYKNAQELSQQINEHFILLYVKYAQARLARIQGDLITARSKLDQMLDLVHKSASHYEWGLYRLEEGRLMMAEDKPVEAITYFQEAIEDFQDERPIETIQAQIKLADAYHITGAKEASLQELKTIFQLASTLEDSHALAVAFLNTTDLLTKVKNDTTVGYQARRLLEQTGRFETDLPVLRRQIRQQQEMTTAIPVTPPRLKIKAFGQAQVTLDNTPITSPMWTKQRTARELFFYLLSEPQGLLRLKLAEIFWPESSTSQIRVQLGNTLYKIRRSLDDPNIILFDSSTDTYYFNRHLDYDYDVEIFKEKFQQGQSTLDIAEQIDTYKTMVELYSGPYLPEVNGTWVLVEREQLERMYLEVSLKLIKLHLEVSEYDLALQYCQQTLAQAPAQEAIHRQAMRAYAALGNQAAVIRQFKQCQQALQEEAGAPISAQTQKLYESLIS